MGILEDKDWQVMCATIAPLALRIVLVPVNSMRTMRPEMLVPFCRAANPDAEVTAHDSVEAAFPLIAQDAFVVVTGSLYLVGEVMEKLGISPGRVNDERCLNEWGASAQDADRGSGG
jgi:folylpolyglutamate synthase/dihydropteroate synthase